MSLCKDAALWQLLIWELVGNLYDPTGAVANTQQHGTRLRLGRYSNISRVLEPVNLIRGLHQCGLM